MNAVPPSLSPPPPAHYSALPRQAADTLTDPAKRKEYDRQLKAMEAAARYASTASPSASGGGMEGLSEIEMPCSSCRQSHPVHLTDLDA
jgi:hypothetical protein